jgi:hypothetical protein
MYNKRNFKIVIYLTSSCVIWDFFGMSGPVENSSETRVLKVHECQKSANYTRTS